MSFLSSILSVIITELCLANRFQLGQYTRYGVNYSTFITETLSGTKMDLSSQDLRNVSEFIYTDITILDLHDNNITHLPGCIFYNLVNLTDLDLSDNLLSALDNNTFRGLYNLEVLNLAGNNLCLPKSYPLSVFNDLRSLKVLKTFSNNCPEGNTDIPDEVFKVLLSLEKLFMDATQNLTFGNGFRNLTNLTHVEASTHKDLCDSDTYNTYIRKDSFHGLCDNKLTHLTLRGCAFKAIEKEAFSNLPYPNTLNLACARFLYFGPLLEVIQRMPNASLTTLVLDRTEMFPNSSSFSTLFCESNFANLRRLSIRATAQVEKLNMDFKGKPCMPNLRHVNLGGNKTLRVIRFSRKSSEAAKDILENGVPVSEFWVLTNIRTVDVSNLCDNFYSVETTYCKSKDQDIEEYFRTVPQFIETIPDLDDFNTSSGFVKPPSDNEIDVASLDGIVTRILIFPSCIC